MGRVSVNGTRVRVRAYACVVFVLRRVVICMSHVDISVAIWAFGFAGRVLLE